MQNSSSLIKVFSADELTINLLQKELMEEGIGSHIQNEYQAGMIAGFAAATHHSIDLLIQEKDLDNAAEIIKVFIDRQS